MFYWKDENIMIFIVGNSRSGTTLMSRILSRHPEIYILNEMHFMEEFANKITCIDTLGDTNLEKCINKMLTIQTKGYYRKAENDNFIETKGIRDQFKREENKEFSTLINLVFKHEALKHGKRIPGDQTPRHIFYVREIKNMFPEAKFINMIRDPRAVLLSQKFKWKAGLRKKVPLFETIRTYLNYHPILMSIMWRRGIKSALIVNQDIKKNSWLDVKFENLTTYPEETVKKICNFLNVPFKSDMLNVTVSMSSTKTDEGKKIISKKVATKWIGNLSLDEIYLSELINKDLMRHLGYPIINKKPSVIKLIIMLSILPIQTLIVVLLNYSRMGNPLSFLKKRFVNP